MTRTEATASNWLLCTFLLAVTPCSAQHDVAQVLPSGWTQNGQDIIGQPMSQPLDSGWLLGETPATVEIEITLAKATTTAASLMIGNCHIGFCGSATDPD